MFLTRPQPRGQAERGLTLIELMITITVLGFLLAMMAPAMGTWMANSKVRGIAESLQNELRLAQSTAVERNRQAVLALTNATPALTATPVANGLRWFVRVLPLVSAETVDSTYLIHASTQAVQAGVTITGPALVCFNSMGHPVTNSSTGLSVSCSAPTSATSPITYTVAHTGADRTLKVLVYMGGQVRLCDAAKTLSSSHPDGCPSS